MKMLRLTPMLTVPDIKKSVEFYTLTLGFTCNSIDEEKGWASLTWDETEIMLALPHAHVSSEKPYFTGSLYFTCDSVDTIWVQLKDKCRICYPIQNFDYGMREFAIYDNNGYLLQFGQALIF